MQRAPATSTSPFTSTFTSTFTSPSSHPHLHPAAVPLRPFFTVPPCTPRQVRASHRGLVLIVYQTCGRFGPQQPLAFANAEQRPSVAVHFPCTAAAPLFIFWNAEYVPGSFAFEVSDA